MSERLQGHISIRDARVVFDAMEILNANGVLCLLSVTGGSGTNEEPIEKINQQLVLGNPGEPSQVGGAAILLERAKTVGLPEGELAFARIALALHALPAEERIENVLPHLGKLTYEELVREGRPPLEVICAYDGLEVAV